MQGFYIQYTLFTGYEAEEIMIKHEVIMINQEALQTQNDPLYLRKMEQTQSEYGAVRYADPLIYINLR